MKASRAHTSNIKKEIKNSFVETIHRSSLCLVTLKREKKNLAFMDQKFQTTGRKGGVQKKRKKRRGRKRIVILHKKNHPNKFDLNTKPCTAVLSRLTSDKIYNKKKNFFFGGKRDQFYHTETGKLIQMDTAMLQH